MREARVSIDAGTWSRILRRIKSDVARLGAVKETVTVSDGDWAEINRVIARCVDSCRRRDERMAKANAAQSARSDDSLPLMCFIQHPEYPDQAVIVCRGQEGYFPTDVSWDDAKKINQAQGKTLVEIARMTAGSMFGWDCPAARGR